MVLRREGHRVDAFDDPRDFLASYDENPCDLVITDLKMPAIDGVELLRRVKSVDSDVPVILITAHATLQTAIEAMREGAFDYLEKPIDNDACKALVSRALEMTRLSRENRVLRGQLREQFSFDRFITVSAVMDDAMDMARRAARSRSTVLISGDSGTGKELIARAIHYYSDRVGKPFIAVNCKALATGVLESELFGHEKGAFTGASHARPGIFEQADGGTLLLDEIGEVDLAFQGKLLRVLQEREVQRVGGNATRAIDVRVLAATNRDLGAAVASGEFREDLFFRLAVIPIVVPPLRERRDDVLPLARHFLAKFSAEMGRAITGWSETVEAHLIHHDWPGNVRELENAIERAVVLARDSVISMEDLLPPGAAVPGSTTAEGAAEDADLTLNAYLDRAAERRIRAVLTETRGVRVDAARRLGIERTTLYRLMKKFGIDDG